MPQPQPNNSLPAPVVGVVTQSVAMKNAPKIRPPDNAAANGSRPNSSDSAKTVPIYAEGMRQSIILKKNSTAAPNNRVNLHVSPNEPGMRPKNKSR